MRKQTINMTKNISKAVATLLVVVLTSSLTMAQSEFEGVITYNTTNASVQEKATVTWHHKNGQNLMEFDSHAGEYHLQYALIMGTNDQTAYLRSDNGSQEISEIKGEEVFTSANFVRKVRTTEAGYECEMLMFKSNGNDLTYWVTSEIDLAYADLPKLVKSNMPSLKGISNGFPVKMELRDSSGNLLRSQEVVSVKAAKVDESKFERK